MSKNSKEKINKKSKNIHTSKINLWEKNNEQAIRNYNKLIDK